MLLGDHGGEVVRSRLSTSVPCQKEGSKTERVLVGVRARCKRLLNISMRLLQNSFAAGNSALCAALWEPRLAMLSMWPP